MVDSDDPHMDEGADNNDAINSIQENENTNSASAAVSEVDVENRDDEFGPEAEVVEEGFTRTRSGRISKPHNYAEQFPETVHLQVDNRRCIRLFYYDELSME